MVNNYDIHKSLRKTQQKIALQEQTQQYEVDIVEP